MPSTPSVSCRSSARRIAVTIACGDRDASVAVHDFGPGVLAGRLVDTVSAVPNDKTRRNGGRPGALAKNRRSARWHYQRHQQSRWRDIPIDAADRHMKSNLLIIVSAVLLASALSTRVSTHSRPGQAVTAAVTGADSGDLRRLAKLPALPHRHLRALVEDPHGQRRHRSRRCILRSCCRISPSPIRCSRSSWTTWRSCTDRNGSSAISRSAAMTITPCPRSGMLPIACGGRTSCSPTPTGGCRTIRPTTCSGRPARSATAVIP